LVILIEGIFADHYPVEHWLFRRSRIYRQMIGRL